jgi:large subunit ribosomal protein L18
MLAKVLKRLRRKSRIRATISWTSVKPRLAVFRSNKSIYAQIIDDVTWSTICSSSDLKIEKSTTKVEMAKKVWEDIAKKANSANITTVVFDRGGFAYHGRVKALADAAREAWLNF